MKIQSADRAMSVRPSPTRGAAALEARTLLRVGVLLLCGLRTIVTQGCGGSSSHGTSADGGGTTADAVGTSASDATIVTCQPGNYGCPCSPDNTCNIGFECTGPGGVCGLPDSSSSGGRLIDGPSGTGGGAGGGGSLQDGAGTGSGGASRDGAGAGGVGGGPGAVGGTSTGGAGGARDAALLSDATIDTDASQGGAGGTGGVGGTGVFRDGGGTGGAGGKGGAGGTGNGGTADAAADMNKQDLASEPVAQPDLPVETADVGCVASCAGQACGADDGCGGVCASGSCPSGQHCTSSGCAVSVCDASPTCNVAADCPSTGTLCIVNSCIDGCCATSNASPHAYCENGRVCDGEGHCFGCISDSDCSFLNGKTATVYACDIGQHSCVVAYGGSPGHPCNAGDQCESRSCGIARGSGGANCCQDNLDWLKGVCGSTGCDTAGVPVYVAKGTICGGGVCNGAGYCVECISNAQCSGTTPLCNTTVPDGSHNTCVQCVTNADCSGTTPRCNSSHTCW